MKRKNNILLWTMSVLVFLVACKKEPLPELPEENEPYYSIRGNIDDEFVHYKVGQEGTQFTNGISEKNGVRTYYGQLVVPSEDLVLKIEFTRPEKPNGESGKTPFKSNGIDFLVHESGCKVLNFGSNIIQSDYVYVMNATGDFIQTDEIEFEEYGIHDVTLKFSNLGQNIYEVPVKYGFKNSSVDAGFSLQASSDTTFFVAHSQSGEHKWFLDNNAVSTEADFSHVIGIGVHKIKHEFTDEYGNTSKSSALFRVNDFVLDWQMGLTTCAGSTTETNNFGKVMVSVTRDGSLLKSEYNTSNQNKIFSISNVELVGNDAYNPDWVVFDFDFNADLQNSNGTEFLSLTEMEGTFNVGLK